MPRTNVNVSQYIGAEFEDHGRGPKYDCWGLAVQVYKDQLGIELPSYVGDYSSAMDGEEISALVKQEREQLWGKVESPSCGDVVILRINGMPWHCGVVLENGKFLHIERGSNACIDRLDSPRWARRIDGFYRHTSLCHMEHA